LTRWITARIVSRLAVAAVLCADGVAWAEAEEATPDKSEFNLFHPTPSEYMRDMDTDFIESPYTLDAGHFQLEMSADWAQDRDSFDGVDQRWRAWSTEMTLRVGLLDRLDAQLVLEPYISERELRRSSPSPTQSGGSRSTRRGFGDMTLQFKYNVWGNDEGRTALAVAPYVSIPTSDDDLGSPGVEGGLAVPMEFELPGDFDLGVTSQIEAVRDERDAEDHDLTPKFDRGYHPGFGNSVALGHDLFEDLYGYVEFSSFVSTQPGEDWIGAVEAGWSLELTENLQVNAGVSFGVSRWADDVNPYIGIAWRY